MTQVTVQFDGTRIDTSGAGSTRVNIGGGSGSTDEPDLKFQGPEDSSRKIGTSEAGFAITTTPTDVSTATGAYQGMIPKYAVGNWSALDTVANFGVGLRFGSDANNRANYAIDGSETYPIKGGFVIKGLDLNITGYRTSTNGTPSLTAADYWGIIANLNASSKGENLVLSAIDVCNGFIVTGGGGADPTATLADIADFDEQLAERYGIFLRLEGKPGAYNQLAGVQFGTAASPIDYQDTERATVYLPDNLCEAGWSNITDNLENTSTVINPTGNITYISEGSRGGATDTRSVYVATGSAATAPCGRSNQAMENFASFTGVALMTYTNMIVQCDAFDQNGCSLVDVTLRATGDVSGVAMCNDFTIADVTNLTVVQEGVGHFVDLGAVNTQTINWTVAQSGFPTGTIGTNTDTANGDETILVSVNSGQTLTINVAAGLPTPSIKNDGLGNVEIVVPQVTLTISGHEAGDTVVIHDFNGANASLGDELDRFDPAAATELYSYSTSKAGDQITLQMLPTPGTRKRQIRVVTLPVNDSPFIFDPEQETN